MTISRRALFGFVGASAVAAVAPKATAKFFHTPIQYSAEVHFATVAEMREYLGLPPMGLYVDEVMTAMEHALLRGDPNDPFPLQDAVERFGPSLKSQWDTYRLNPMQKIVYSDDEGLTDGR